MLLGYYDRNGYAGLYYHNLIPGGVAELSTFGSGTYLANDAIASSGHIADFYSNAPPPGYPTGYGASSDDVTPPFHSFDSIADFMGTSQDSAGNSNGMTTFWYFTDGYPLSYADVVKYGIQDLSGMYGIKEYVEYSGYSVGTLYNQYIDSLGRPYGLTFAQYQAEIDAGRPALIHIEDHTMLAYGYDTNGATVYIHDTWTAGPHTMTWGGYYGSGMHYGMTLFTPSGGEPIPEPSTIFLVSCGVFGLVCIRVRHRGKSK
jgi:hypothetical protein